MKNILSERYNIYDEREINKRTTAMEKAIEAYLTAAARAQNAIKEAQEELRHMLDIINQGRSERGLPPLDVTF